MIAGIGRMVQKLSPTPEAMFLGRKVKKLSRTLNAMFSGSFFIYEQDISVG